MDLLLFFSFMLLSSKREFKDSHLFCQATTYPGHRFHMDPKIRNFASWLPICCLRVFLASLVQRYADRDC